MTSPDFLPTATLELLRQRAKILAQLRAFFDSRGFIEIETPLLSHDTVVDRHLEPIPVHLPTCSSSSTDSPAWLQTSPEFGMKRVLAAGAQAIYQISKCFRAGESGRHHNPEFTMLEWYRTGDDMQTGMSLLAELIETILVTPPTIRISYQELFENQLDLNPHTATVSSLVSVCHAHGIETEPFEQQNLDRDFWLNLILSQVLEPTLSQKSPVILYHWPASQSALAVVTQATGKYLPDSREVEAPAETPSCDTFRQEPQPPDARPSSARLNENSYPVAERFELYFGGLELANGYHELLDAEELAARNQTVNIQRESDGLRRLPEESRLLDAMRHGLPACAGVALGVDRLVMLATEAKSIREVIAFPFDRA